MSEPSKESLPTVDALTSDETNLLTAGGIKKVSETHELLEKYVTTKQRYRLLVADGNSIQKHSLPPSGMVTLGRSEQNQVVLNHSSVSRNHAALNMGASMTITDLGGSNPIRLDGEPIPQNKMLPLTLGHPFSIGAVVCVVQTVGWFESLLGLFEGAAPAPAPPKTQSEPSEGLTDVHVLAPPPAQKKLLLTWFFQGQLSSQPGKRFLRIWFEAALMGGLVLWLVNALGLAQQGLLTIFFVSVTLIDRFNRIIEDNSLLATQRGIDPKKIKWITTASLVGIFMGLLTAFSGAAILLGEAGIQSSFRFAVEESAVGSDSLLNRNFGHFLPLFLHNLSVCISIGLISIVFRSYGALLAISWNACLWGTILVLMGIRGVEQTELSALLFCLISLVGILPHLLLEGFAYTLGCLAAISIVDKVASDEPSESGSITWGTIAKIVGAALLMVVLGALTEAYYAPQVLAFLQGA